MNALISMRLSLTWIGNFSKCCIPQPTVCILYSLLMKAIHVGSVTPGTITFSCQSATLISDATLLLYAVIIDLERFWLPLLYVFMIISSYFFICVFYFLFYFFYHCYTHYIYVRYVLYNKYSVLITATASLALSEMAHKTQTYHIYP